MQTSAPGLEEPSDARRRLFWSLPVSAGLHVLPKALALLLVFYARHCLPPGPVDLGHGENGESGGGGHEMEFSVQGPPVEHPGPTTPPPAPTAQAVPREPEPPETEPRQPSPPSRSTRRLTARDPNGEAAPASAAHASPPVTSDRARPGGGTGADHTDSGSMPGSVGQQRSLLPHAVVCGDSVAGIWRAQKYDPLYGDWMVATLHIHRTADNSLTGTIVSHQWDGGPHDTHPPPCGPVGLDFIVEMPGSGFVRGNYVDFGASTWRLREMRCNPEIRLINYRPDHFTGVIDADIQEFQSVNNDGGRAHDDPMVFRRIACLPGDEFHAPESTPEVTPDETHAAGSPAGP